MHHPHDMMFKTILIDIKATRFDSIDAFDPFLDTSCLAK